MEAQYGLAATAGLVAALNPCGFALLPAYLSFLVGDGSDDRVGAIRRAVIFTSAVTVGFVTVFGGFGLLAAPAADTVARNAPWVGIAVGVLMVVVGGWLVTGRSGVAAHPRVGRSAPVTRGCLDGAVRRRYALASLGCTIGPFLAIVATSLHAGSTGAGGAVRGVRGWDGAGGPRRPAWSPWRLPPWWAGCACRRAGAPARRRWRCSRRRLRAWYGWYEVRGAGRRRSGDPVVDVAGRVQAALAAGVAALGPWWLSLAVGGAVAIVSQRGWCAGADGDSCWPRRPRRHRKRRL